MEMDPVLAGEIVDPSSGMEPRSPQDLVGEQVADPRHEGLVREGGLHGTVTCSEELEELLRPNVGCIGTEGAEDLVGLARVGGHPHAAELAHVPVPDLPRSRRMMTRSCRCRPSSSAAHAMSPVMPKCISIAGPSVMAINHLPWRPGSCNR
jgi:hypothetical protein